MTPGLIARLKDVVLQNAGSGAVRAYRSFMTGAKSHRARSPVVIFGDSVNIRVSRGDADKRPLGAMLADELESSGPLGTAELAYTAFHPAVFAAVTGAFLKNDFHPAAVVCPVNLRCFSPQWDLHPKYQYHDVLDLAERESRIVTRNEELTIEKYRDVPVPFVGSGVDRIGDVIDLIQQEPADDAERRVRLAAIFGFHYGFPLDPGHRHLRHLTLIRAAGDLIGRPLIFFIAPVNHEAGAEFVKGFESRLAAMVETVRSHLGSSPVLDFSRSFGRKDFFTETNATEHVQEGARRAMAAAVSAMVMKETA